MSMCRPPDLFVPLRTVLRRTLLDGITGGRKTDRIQFRMVAGIVAGFQTENITEVSGDGVSISGGGSSFIDTRRIKPIEATSAPIESATWRKCTLWLKSADGEQQVRFESDEVALREGHRVRVLCASTDGNEIYYLSLVNESINDAYDIGAIPMSAVLTVGAEPMVPFPGYAGLSFFLPLLAGAYVALDTGDVFWVTAALTLVPFLLGLRFYLWNRRRKVRAVIRQRLGEIGDEFGNYVRNASA